MALTDYSFISNHAEATSTLCLTSAQSQSRPVFDINDYLSFDFNEDYSSNALELVNGASNVGGKFAAEASLNSNQETTFSFDQLVYSDKSVDYVDFEPIEEDDDVSFYSNRDDDVPGELFASQIYGHASNPDSYPTSFTPSANCQHESPKDQLTCPEAVLSFEPKYPYLTEDSLKLSNLDHPDFRCSVPANSNFRCRKSILCSLHSDSQKSLVPRSFSFVDLIRNYKNLLELRTTLLETKLQVLDVGMKRHNSFQDELHIERIKSNESKSVRVDDEMIEYEQVNRVASESLSQNDEFYNNLVLKLSMVKPNPEERLLEFSYNVNMKNFSTIEFYKKNGFEF